MTERASSAGILLFRRREAALELLLVHPGGPFWRNKDLGAWQIPKGLIAPGEAPVAAAFREAGEELGRVPEGVAIPLGDVRQKGGKHVIAFAVEGDFDPDFLASNDFEMEWPPRSGRMQRFPEVDRAVWFGVDAARAAMLPSQLPLIDRLVDIVTMKGL